MALSKILKTQIIPNLPKTKTIKNTYKEASNGKISGNTL